MITKRDIVWCVAFEAELRRGCHGQLERRELDNDVCITRIDATATARAWADEAARAATEVSDG